ncbi:MAG: hypothetical protein AB9907_01285 [Flexilinea sp.]
MKIALINGSPRGDKSASAALITYLKTLLPDEYEKIDFHFRTPGLNDQDLERIFDSDVLVFAFPLYVDGLPSHLIHCLYQMETAFKAGPPQNRMVYALVNCGFFEGHQTAIALDIIKNWCEKAKLSWGQGAGFGGGGMIPMLSGVPYGKGPTKNFSITLNTIAGNIVSGTTAENLFVSPNFPRFAYKMAAEMGWRGQIKANGLKRKDLFTKK